MYILNIHKTIFAQFHQFSLDGHQHIIVRKSRLFPEKDYPDWAEKAFNSVGISLTK